MVIVGCGRTGSGLAERLVARGCSVAVVDLTHGAFRRIKHLDVDRIEGVGFDRETLLRAGIERASGLAAVTNGDNSNIVVARTARESFKVPRVFARIYDMRRAAIYERLGIPTVASAALTIEMSLRHLAPDDDEVRWVDPTARVCLVERAVTAEMVGRPIVDLEHDGRLRVMAVRRLGAAVLPTAGLVAQEGDLLYAAVPHDLPAGTEER